MSGKDQSVDMDKLRPVISFIIPAYNEQDMLPALFQSLERYVSLNHEIVVVDNGSNDATVFCARDAGATVLSRPGLSIGALRNEGVRHSCGEVLVFLDADVRLTAEWAEAISGVLTELRAKPLQLTGARGIPEGTDWIGREWFAPLVRRPMRYIVTSHLIVPRVAFETVGGFDETLQTGEDADFSARAVAKGLPVCPRPQLLVRDAGFPRTLGAFFKRERWHGRGDGQSYQHLLRSPIALGATALVICEVSASLLALTGLGSLSLIPLLAASVLTLGFSVQQRRFAGLWSRCLHVCLAWVYLHARALSLLDAALQSERSVSSPHVRDTGTSATVRSAA